WRPTAEGPYPRDRPLQPARQVAEDATWRLRPRRPRAGDPSRPRPRPRPGIGLPAAKLDLPWPPQWNSRLRQHQATARRIAFARVCSPWPDPAAISASRPVDFLCVAIPAVARNGID